MAADLSQYKEAIANAYEGRAVRDAIVAMVQAVEDAINADDTELAGRVDTLTETVQLLDEKATYIERAIYERGGLADQVSDLDTRVTALEGGGNT